MQGVIFNFLMAKVIPVSKRGRLTGMRNFLAGIISAIVAWISGQFLVGDTPDRRRLFVYVPARVRADEHRPVRADRGARTGTADGSAEGRSAHAPRTGAGAAAQRSCVHALLRWRARSPRWAAWRCRSTSCTRAQTAALSGATLGILTFAFTLSGTFSNLLWGPLGDRKGFRITFLASIGLWVASTVLLMLVSGNLPVTVLVFIGIGAAVQGFQNASQNMTLEFGYAPRPAGPYRNREHGIGVRRHDRSAAGRRARGGRGLSVRIHRVDSCSWCLGGIVVARYVPEPRKQGDFL